MSKLTIMYGKVLHFKVEMLLFINKMEGGCLYGLSKGELRDLYSIIGLP